MATSPGDNLGIRLLREIRDCLKPKPAVAHPAISLPAVSSRIQVSETLVTINNLPNDPPLCRADPRRWELIFSSAGTGGFLVSMRSPDGTTGLASLNAAPIRLKFPDDGPLVQQQWNGIGISGAISITVYEVILLPPR